MIFRCRDCHDKFETFEEYEGHDCKRDRYHGRTCQICGCKLIGNYERKRHEQAIHGINHGLPASTILNYRTRHPDGSHREAGQIDPKEEMISADMVIKSWRREHDE
jgi:hypothetical protein